MGYRGVAAAVRRGRRDRVRFPGWPPSVATLALDRHRRGRSGSGHSGRRPALGKRTRSALRRRRATRSAAGLDHRRDAGARAAGHVRHPDRRGRCGGVAVPWLRRRVAGSDEVGRLRGPADPGGDPGWHSGRRHGLGDVDGPDGGRDCDSALDRDRRDALPPLRDRSTGQRDTRLRRADGAARGSVRRCDPRRRRRHRRRVGSSHGGCDAGRDTRLPAPAGLATDAGGSALQPGALRGAAEGRPLPRRSPHRPGRA
jgi:hypothetical protein